MENEMQIHDKKHVQRKEIWGFAAKNHAANLKTDKNWTK